MSELIQNGTDRKEQLKTIIREIDSGRDVETAKKSFAKLIRSVSPEEIAELEQSLIAEGMPVAKVQSLCDLHVEAFEDALKRSAPEKPLPGHPVDTCLVEPQGGFRNMVNDISGKTREEIILSGIIDIIYDILTNLNIYR